jgi:hypothetical protein
VRNGFRVNEANRNIVIFDAHLANKQETKGKLV